MRNKKYHQLDKHFKPYHNQKFYFSGNVGWKGEEGLKGSKGPTGHISIPRTFYGQTGEPGDDGKDGPPGRMLAIAD